MLYSLVPALAEIDIKFGVSAYHASSEGRGDQIGVSWPFSHRETARLSLIRHIGYSPWVVEGHLREGR